jgi:hypothetical protein
MSSSSLERVYVDLRSSLTTNYAVGLTDIKNKTPGIEPGVRIGSRLTRLRKLFDSQPLPF